MTDKREDNLILITPRRTSDVIYGDIVAAKRMREKESQAVWHEWSKKIYRLEEELKEVENR